MERGAKISECGRYRYVLTRTWDEWSDCACIIMLNPSTADALVDDATIRALVRLLPALGYGGFEVVNLFALRSTDPSAILAAGDPVGPRNDDHIAWAIARCDIVICAWGAHRSVLQSKRGIEVYRVIDSMGRAAWCFGKTKANRAPKHPLYLKTGTELELYDG